MRSGPAEPTLERAMPQAGRTAMTLTLRAVSLNDQPLTQPITAHFDAQGGTIGRADQSTLALPDPERHISRRQADIIAAGDGYRIKNVGSANPILVRGQALGQGESAALTHRDSVRIGGYLLEVTDDAADAGRASTITQGRAAVDARSAAQAPRTGPGAGQPASVSLTGRAAAGGASGGLGDLGAPLSSSNPFADLMGEPTPAPSFAPPPVPVPAARAPTPPIPIAAPMLPPVASPVPPRTADPFADLFGAAAPAASGVPASSAAWGAPPAAPVARLPDDFDPFAAPPPPARAERQPSSASPAGAFDDLIPSAAPSSIDDLFGLPRGQGDPLAAFMADAAPPREPGAAGVGSIGGVALSTDPMALFGSPPPPVAESRPALADHVPEMRGAFRPPGIVVPSPPPVVEPPAPPPLAPVRTPPVAAIAASAAAELGSADAHALWAAFSEAAGLRLQPPQGLNPELMRVIGTLLRTSIEGTLQLMSVRAATRVELRAQVTMIQARNNNPLKFSPDAQSALEQMLQPPMRGFLPGPAAMTESMNDLVGHSIGTMAGTRAALEGVLDRFAPKELEAKLAGKSMLDSVLPMARKARLWELYLQHFETIRNEAQEDFQNLFGKAFLAAYEQQLDRLHNDKKPSGG
jgi:FHA domain-containing protein